MGAGGGLNPPQPSHKRPPLSPQEGWISDGLQVLHFRPARWDKWAQTLEVTFGELCPRHPVPLLRHRREISREEAIQLWSRLRREGWRPCPPQWVPPPPPRLWGVRSRQGKQQHI
ncbi:MAG: DUF1651 domain-containing protein [Cyanobacteriota bacterium]|jgi:hypothetical protein